MPRGYTTEAKIEDYLLQNIDPTFSYRLSEWIEAVERIIEKETGRIFIADSEASARLFDGDDTDLLLIDDCISVTKVEVGQDSYGNSFTEISASGSDRYFLEPPNYSDILEPVSRVRLNARVFPEGRQNNRITARWGYADAVPEDISFAATVFVAGILNQHRQGGDEIKSEKIGSYQVTYNTDQGSNSFGDFERAKEILNKYKKLFI